MYSLDQMSEEYKVCEHKRLFVYNILNWVKNTIICELKARIKINKQTLIIYIKIHPFVRYFLANKHIYFQPFTILTGPTITS